MAIVQDSEAGDSVEALPVSHDPIVRWCTIGIFLILGAAALYFARDFLLPVSLAFLIAMVLSPIVRVMRRRSVPEPVTAAGLVVALVGLMVLGSYTLSGPVAHWVAEAPVIANDIREKIAVIRRPMEAVADATREVEELTDANNTEDPRVVVSDGGFLGKAATSAAAVVAQLGLALVLLLFLLGSGDMFYEKLVRALPTLSDKKRGVRIARSVEREVSRYLFTITLINIGLGIAIGLSMFVIGMPNPLLWGVVAAILNFIPYIGAFIGIMGSAAVALVTLPTFSHAIIPPLAYLFWNIIESQLVTPTVVGRRLEMNAVAVFLAVAFWGWLWGIVGALIAVPMLVTVKVFADHVDGLGALGEFLGARHVGDPGGTPPTDTSDS